MKDTATAKAGLQKVAQSSNRGSRKGEHRGGRKKGTPNRSTKLRRDVAEQALREGKAPLEVMLEAMREAYKAGGAVAAAPFAKEAAPYVHPKRSAIDASVQGGLVIELVQFGADAASDGGAIAR